MEYVGDYFPYGKIIREYVKGKKEKYLTTHHERDEETGLDYRGARFYDADVGRFLSLDPLAADYPALSDYSYVAGNPIIYIDPTGKSVDDIVFKDNNGKEVKRIETNLVDAEYNVSELKSPSNQLINDVSNIIREGGADAFVSMYDDLTDNSSFKRYLSENNGGDFFFNVANSFEFESSGWLGDLIEGNEAVSDGFHISEWTHSLIADGSPEMNDLEHHVGSFLMNAKYGEGAAFVITTANEVRGLLINDRQNGNMLRALEGGGGTAFEWRDLSNNSQGSKLYQNYISNKVSQWSYFDQFQYRLFKNSN